MPTKANIRVTGRYKIKHCQNTKSILKPRGILNTLQENTEVHSCTTSYCNSMNEVLDKTDSVHGS